MNILYHHRTQGTGAEGVHIAYIIKGFQRLGHTVDVVCPNDTDPAHTAGENPHAGKASVKAGILDGISRVLPQFLFETLELLYNCAAYFKLKRVLRSHSVQMLYERHAFFLWIGAYLAKRHHCLYAVEINEVAGEARVRPQVFTGLARTIERYVFNRADAIIVVSAFIKEHIEALGIDGGNIHVVPNGVDEHLFDPALHSGQLRERLRISDRAIVIGFIGWFVAWHHLERLIDVFGQITSDKDIRLMLVGDGVLKERLVAMAKTHGVADRVLFPGAIAYQHIPEYVNAMDICVIPGSNQYRSPIKLFEYMAMKKAVVAPRLAPIMQVLEDHRNGVLFDQNDANSLKEALTDLIEHDETRVHLGDNARRTVLAQHTWNLNAKRIIDSVAYRGLPQERGHA